MANKEILYEKITEISEKKNTLQEENENLKKQLSEYNENLFENFCEFVQALVDNIDFSKDNIDEIISESREDVLEKKMAKYFANKIKEMANAQNLNVKNIMYMIYDRIKKL